MRQASQFFQGVFIALLISACQSSDNKSKTTQRDGEAKTSDPKSISFNEWLANPFPIVSAHRGGPYPGFPENSTATFENVASQTPTVIECDIAMTRDSVLVLMHDKTVDRTTTGSGKVNELSFEDLRKLKLVDNHGDTTDFEIPTLSETLIWGKDKALFTLDIKRGVPFEMVVQTIQELEASSYAAIITYRIQDAILVHQLDTSLMISVSAGDDGALEQIRKSDISYSKLLGFVGTREPEVSHYGKLQKMGIKTILGTLGNLDRSAIAKGDDSAYRTYVQNGANIIATDRPIEVAKAIKDN